MFSPSHKYSLDHNSGSFHRLQDVAEMSYSQSSELKHL